MALKEKFLSWFPTTSLQVRPEEDRSNARSTSGAAHTALMQYYLEKTNVSHKRSKIYDDMDDLDDEMIARALDMEADDATQMDLHKGKSVWITSKSEKKKKIIEDMLSRVQAEQRIWLWMRDTNKYGDFFVRLSIDPKKGILSVQDNYHPKEICRLENRGKLAGFLYLDRTNRNMTPHDAHEWIHFRNIKYRIEDDILPDEFFRKYEIDKNARYGSPSLIKVRRIEKQLRLAEDSLILGRLSRSQHVQIHYVNVGDSGTTEQKDIVSNYERLFSKNHQVNYQKDTFRSDHSSLSYADRVFVPVRTHEKGRSDVQEIGGNLDVTSIADIDRLDQKRFGAMGIPKEYMSFDSTMGFNTLMQLDPRYARKIANHQKNIMVGLTLMAQLELYIHGEDPDPSEFQIHMTSVSTTNELERTDSLNALIDAGERLVRLFSDVRDDIDRKYLYQYLITHYLRLPDIDLDKLFSEAGAEVPDGDPGFSPENPQQFFNTLKEAIEQDPEVYKLLNKFVASYQAKGDSKALEQRIKGESYDEETLARLKETTDKKGSVLKKREEEIPPLKDDETED